MNFVFLLISDLYSDYPLLLMEVSFHEIVIRTMLKVHIGTEVMVFVYSFAVGGAGGRVTNFPTWALNPTGNPDYCKRLT